MEIYAKHGRLVQITYLILAVINWLLFGRYICRKKIVLCYHGITERQRNAFRDQMVWLADYFAKKTFLSSRKDLNYQPVVLTFDDAFENLLNNALPLLNELRIPAIVFAVPGNLGQSPKWNIASDHPDYKEKIMTAQQLRDIQTDLIKIGSHTQTHTNLSKLLPKQVRWELTESKKNLEQLLGRPIEDLALPYRVYNEEVLAMAQEAGYKRIYTLDSKPLALESQGPVIGRFSMSPDVWKIEFILTCTGAYSWLGPWRGFIRQLRHRIHHFTDS